MLEAVRIEVSGVVQGVGFRPWLYGVAQSLGLKGSIRNTRQGVLIEVEGSSTRELFERIRTTPPIGSWVERVTLSPIPCFAPDTLRIDTSVPLGTPQLTVPPDLGICGDCQAELRDPGSRYHGHPFVSCTQCGPRYSLVESLPYDRERTTMADFPLCASCAQEYQDPLNRRFHAQATSCGVCGPKLWWSTGERLESFDGLFERLARAEVLAIQGLGGFHLVCDASSSEAVRKLRDRKRREAKPFAVLARDLEVARSLADWSEAELRALAASERPIVLGRARPSVLSPLVSADSSRVGVMLPSTPQMTLMADYPAPLVMTSGNLSGEPIAVTHREAQERLSGLVDGLLFHDRRIARRVEDSVVATLGGTVRTIRRARGHAPAPLRLARKSPEPILAVGGQLKNTLCWVDGDRAYLSPHLGDLESFSAEQAFHASVEDFVRLMGGQPKLLVHDLHPEYVSTQWARAQSVPSRGVQHHVAHAVATMAEYGVEEPVLAVVMDGTGYGQDGTMWGGEFLVIDGLHWWRAAALAPLELPGGEVAIREVERVGFAVLRAAGWSVDEIVETMPANGLEGPQQKRRRLEIWSRMRQERVNTPRARGLGRWFDAAGAVLLGRGRSEFEGEVAMALEEHCGGCLGSEAYPHAGPERLSTDSGWLGTSSEISFLPAFSAMRDDLRKGLDSVSMARRFHAMVVEVCARTAQDMRRAFGVQRVVLSGGCFQNRLLCEGLLARLGADDVLLPREVPMNDGGLSLGQAYWGVLELSQENKSCV